jgi:Flp pilus assembly protein TadB
VAAALLSGASVMAAGDAAHLARSRVRRLSSSGPALSDRALSDRALSGRARSGPALSGLAVSGRGLSGSALSDAALGPAVGDGATRAGAAGGWFQQNAGRTSACAVSATALLMLAVRSLGSGPVLAAVAPPLFLLARWRWAARSAARRQQREVAAALPRFADLVAACLESGAAPADALDVVRRHLEGPLADRLAPVVGALRSGVDPLTVYDSHGRDDPLRGMVVGMARAMESGAPLADMVAAVADDQRRRRRWSAEAAARRAGVHAVGPLVLCFLPAFVLLGVVPVVLSIAAEVLGDLS